VLELIGGAEISPFRWAGHIVLLTS
jgi:hypothetical protein